MFDFPDAQVGVQGRREAERRVAGVLDFKLDVDACIGDADGQLGLESMRPDGAGLLVIGNAQRRHGEIIAGSRRDLFHMRVRTMPCWAADRYCRIAGSRPAPPPRTGVPSLKMALSDMYRRSSPPAGFQETRCPP